MRLLGSVFLLLTLLFPAHAENRGTSVSTHLNDEVMLTEEFLRVFFPQIAGRDANIVLNTELYLWNTTRTKPWATPTPIQFQVVDWCAPPPARSAPIWVFRAPRLTRPTKRR